MKKALHIAGLLLLIFAQSWSQQMNNWYLSPKKIDMTGPTPVPTPISPIYGVATAVAAGQVGNGFYDAAGNLLFYVADASVYDYNNTLLGKIENASTEISIVPFGDNNSCQRKFNIFSVIGGFGGLTYIYKAVLDMNSLSLTSTKIDSISSPIVPGQPISEFGALAVSKTNSNNERYLYFLAGPGTINGAAGQINLLTIHNNGTVTANGKIYPTALEPNANAGGEVFTQELDLSVDGKWLAWASFADVTNGAGTQYRYHFLELDATTGNYITNSYKKFNLPSNYTGNNTQGFRGVEFYQSGTKTTLFFGAGTDGIFYTDLPGASSFKLVSNSFGASVTSFGFSQIEMAKNKFMYASSALTSINIGAFEPSNTSPIMLSGNSFSLPTPVPMAVWLSNPFYTLPDQIDGQDYSTIVPAAATAVLTANTYTFGAASSQTATWTYAGSANPWNTTSEAIHIIKELRIKNNSHLTINGMTFNFSPQAKVIIEQGSSLTMDGTTFTDNFISDPCFVANTWIGVEVWGHNTTPQSALQGKLIMKGGSKIEFAQCGARAWDGINLNTTGGMITASDGSTFLNNNIDIEFKKYDISARSSFYDCFFTTSNQYPFLTAPVHVLIDNCGSITFNNCTFNQTSMPVIDLQSTGIKATDGGFTAFNLNFEQLCYGINATRITTNRPFTVNSSTFNNNYTGILINSVNNITIQTSNFIVGNYQYQSSNLALSHTGIQFQNSSGYIVQENNFNKFLTPVSGISCRGININTSGPAENEIYKNNFNNLDYGNIATGVNRDNSTTSSIHGLQYFCNLCAANTYRDFQIGSPDLTTYGIKLFQGSTILPAGNTFSHFGVTGSKSDINNNTLKPIDYYANSNSTLQIPTYTYNTILHTTASANLCPSRIDGTPSYRLTNAKILLLTANYTLNEIAYLNLKYAYDLLLDGGNQNALLSLINQSTVANAIQLRDALLAKSPYLSQDILRQTAHLNVLPNSMLNAVCIANPDAIKDLDFTDYLQNSIANPLPQNMINLQLASWNVATARTTMESLLGHFSYQMAVSSDRILADLYLKRNYNNDSINIIDTVNYDAKIRYWLNRIPTLTAKYDLIESYFNSNNISAAQNVLDSIPFKFSLSDDQLYAYNDYVYFYYFRKNCLTNGMTLSNLSPTQINDLEAFAAGNSNLAKSLAQNLLCYYYNKCIDLNIETSSSNRLLNFEVTKTEETLNTIYVAPNPAAQYTVFNYNFLVQNGKATLVIYDVTGKVIEQMSLGDKQGEQVWDTRNVPNGLYYYFVKNGDNKIASGKIAVEK